MKTTILSSVLVFLFFFPPVQAQNQELLHKYHLLKGDVLLVQNAQNEDTKVNPYYKNDFQEGLIHFPNNAPLPAVIRYDLLKEEMQVLLKGNTYQVLQDNVPVEINNISFEKFNYLDDNKVINQGYFEVITDTEANPSLVLLKKHFKEKKSDLRSEARGFPAKYVDRSDYFLKFGKYRPAALIPVKTNEFVAHFNEHAPQIETFIKDKKLKLKKEEDLVMIVNYYNSLTNNSK